jgi:2,4-dienoyl-CoA reductase-like NADH-dependent reductase (Old Yellow Enzyme family)
MKTLFDATTIKGKRLKNRLFRSATWERLADDNGRVTPQLAAVYNDLAQGGVGGIIASATFMSPRSKALPGQLGLCDASYLDGHRLLTDAAHQSGAVILLQLAFAGQDGKRWTPADASVDDLEMLPELFANAVRLAKQAGYDGAQIHAAHGYFLSQFLNPATNTRQDAYGGSLQGRCALLLAIFAAMRQEAGKDFLLAVKLDCRDLAGSPGVFETCQHASRELAVAGIDFVEISGLGGHRGLTDGPDQAESVFRDEAAIVASSIATPVILVGANRSPESMTRILGETNIAYFALSRPLLREPDLPHQWQAGSTEPSRCLSCGGCYSDEGNRCLFADAE